MSEYGDLKDMIDVLAVAISREEVEERFFRRSAEASSRKMASKMFAEIADEFSDHRKSLETRRALLEQALKDMSG